MTSTIYNHNDETPHVMGPAILTTSRHGTSVNKLLLPEDPTDTTLPKLIAVLGGQEAYEALPVLDLTQCSGRKGGTGYIDFVRPEDMKYSVMRGVDEHGRPFVSFRLKHDDKEFVETVFRRYVTGPVWTSGGGHVLCNSAMTDEDLACLGRLVRGETLGVRKHTGLYGEKREKFHKLVDECGDPEQWSQALWDATILELTWVSSAVKVGRCYYDAKDEWLTYEVGQLRLV